MEHRVITDYTNVNLENVHLKVYVRLRPPGDGSNAVDPRFMERFPGNSKKITLRDPAHHYGEYAFMFDQVFWTDASQEEVFNQVCKPQVDHTLAGFNSCCFAYGQTGSGKTHTMFGSEGESRGLIPRSIEYLCAQVEARRSKAGGSGEVAMVVSFLEIYCDQIRDLGRSYLSQQQQAYSQGGEGGGMGGGGGGLAHHGSSQHLMRTGMGGSWEGGGGSMALTRKTSEIFSRIQAARQESFARRPSSESHLHGSGMTRGESGLNMSNSGLGGDDYQSMNLEIREDAEGNVFVKDLTLIPVSSLEEVMGVINEGLKLRATHETKMNQVSSRSHTVFTVTVMQRGCGPEGEAVSGTLHLVDLAGSERLKKSDSQGMRLREAVHINSSLTALGKVVVALDPTSERTHVPYRDSKLTRILQNSLGGNSYTAVVTTMHPLHDYSEECLSSLQFANRCRNVQNQPRINYIGVTEADKDKRIKRLTEEVGNLNRKLRQADSKHNEKLLLVLKQLGMKAMMLSDGTIETADGKRIGLGGQVMMLSGDGAGPGGMHGLGGAEGGGEGEGEWGGAKAAAAIAKLTRSVEALKLELLEATRKKEQRKKQVEALQEELRRYRASADARSKDLRAQVQDKQQQADKRSRQLRDLASRYRASHREQLERLAADNTALLKEQQHLITSVPESLRVNSALLARAKDIEEHCRKEEAEKVAAQLKDLALGKDTQMENLRQQYEYWLTRKTQQIDNFVKEFNAYRTKKREEVSVLSGEVLVLHDYASTLKRLLERVQSGLYPIRQAAARFTIEIPKADKPPREVLTDPTALPATKKLLERRQKETLLLQQAQHRATQALCSTAKLNEVAAEKDMQSILRSYSRTLTGGKADAAEDHHQGVAGGGKRASPSGMTMTGAASNRTQGFATADAPPVRMFLTTANGATLPNGGEPQLPADGASASSESSSPELLHAEDLLPAEQGAAPRPQYLQLPASTSNNNAPRTRPQSAQPVVTRGSALANNNRPGTAKPPGRGLQLAQQPQQLQADGRLRPQSAPPMDPQTTGGKQRQPYQQQQQAASLEEEAGVWEADEEPSLSAATPPAGGRHHQQHASSTQRQGSEAAGSVAAAAGSEHMQGTNGGGSRAIFSDYSEEGGPHGAESRPAQQQQQASTSRGQQQQQRPVVASEGNGWEQQNYSAGQQLWGISLRELKHRRESADSFGQVSVSDESGSNPRAALGNSNGAGGDSIYKDYDDGDEEEEDEDQLLLAQQQQQEREDEEEEERARYGQRGGTDKKAVGGNAYAAGPSGAGEVQSSSSASSSSPPLPLDVDLRADPEHLSGPALKRLVKAYQAYLAHQFGQQVERQVVAELSSHGTVQHIKSLQQEVCRYQDTVRDQNRRYMELRASYDSLTRQLEKHRRQKQQQQHAASMGLDGGPSMSEVRASLKLGKRPVSASVRAV